MHFSRALIAGLVCSVFAAAVSAAPVTTQGTGVGKHGDVTVAVTFDSGKIKDIKIVKQQENPVLAAKVFTDLKQHVIDTNSVQLDAISGATFSSKGFLDAVADAAKKAGVTLSKADKKAIKKVVKTLPKESTYDVVVIGAGPGGYETAIKAAQCGKKTCIIEGAGFGGTCLNVGCIPTKALIQTADVYHKVKDAARFAVTGVEADKIAVDMAALQARKKAVVKTLVNGVKGLLRGNKVTVVEGMASFADAHTLSVDGRSITGANIIIATGSSVFMPPFLALEGENHLLTSTEALDLDQVPASVTVIGGGVIGVEFAYLLNRLGSKVTVLELMDHILPMVDIEVSRLAEKRMTKNGILFRLGAKVSRVKDDTVYYEFGGQNCQVKSDMVLMAVGRVPNTQGLNAEGIGIEFDRKAIRTDAHMRTNIPHIYAIGDVNGKVMLAHTASHEGMVAVADICGQGEEMRYDRIPSCVYLEPEIACIGLTEAQAREKYGDGLKIGRFNMAANGKSLIAGDTDGLFKVIVAADTGEILGAHLYGQHVTDMIGEISAAMAAEGTAEELIHAIHPHPTVNEALGEAFMAAWNGRAINSL